MEIYFTNHLLFKSEKSHSLGAFRDAATEGFNKSLARPGDTEDTLLYPSRRARGGEAKTKYIMKKKTVTFRTQYTFKPDPGQTFTEPSMTVPGEAYTIPELFEKARGGVPIDSIINVREPYDQKADETHEHFAPEGELDLADIHEMKTQAEDIIEDAKQKLSKPKKKKGAQATKKSDEGATSSPETPDPNKTVESEISASNEPKEPPSD